jgi:hypothetical protein
LLSGEPFSSKWLGFIMDTNLAIRIRSSGCHR